MDDNKMEKSPLLRKSLIFDSGPIISLTTTNLLWLLDYLKEYFNGDFYIPESVKNEIVDYPLTTKKFKFEALQVYYRISKNVLEVISEKKITELGKKLEETANKLFKAKGTWIKIVHPAEMEVLAAAIIEGASAVVIDERNTRVLIEEPEKLRELIEQQLETPVELDQESLHLLQEEIGNIKVIRSIELVMIGLEKGALDRYLIKRPDAKKLLVESLLWGIKLHGCAVSRREIREITDMEQN